MREARLNFASTGKKSTAITQFFTRVSLTFTNYCGTENVRAPRIDNQAKLTNVGRIPRVFL